MAKLLELATLPTALGAVVLCAATGLVVVYIGGRTVDGQIKSQAEADGDILTFDDPDAALERAANGEQTAFTWVYCTNGYYWYDCSWPQ